MQEVLFGYELNPTTWAYMSSMLIVGVYFKFGRFWSVRNLDLMALIGFVPGMLLLYHGLKKQSGADAQVGHSLEEFGYIWLFGVAAFFLIRLLLDTLMVRRPLLEPNLSASGLTFSCVSLVVFLMANVVTTQRIESPEKVTAGRAERLEDVLSLVRPQQAPGYPWFYRFAGFSASEESSSEDVSAQDQRPSPFREVTRRATAILGHLAVVFGLVLIGYRHFDNLQTGVAVACLYLLFFCTSQMVGRVDHVVPAALLLWAVAAYRVPVAAGVLIGLAGGLVYYPLFLLPLWCGFYWRRGLIRFSIGAVSALLLLIVLALFAPEQDGSFSSQLAQMFGFMNPMSVARQGFWQSHEPVFRMPVLAAFIALCGSLAPWPAQKNFGTLLSCSAAVMLSTQFWQAYQGGIHVAWYLPLLLLTIFRPNLEDRVAVSALAERRIFSR